jgi:hypothetical protein
MNTTYKPISNEECLQSAAGAVNKIRDLIAARNKYILNELKIFRLTTLQLENLSLKNTGGTLKIATDMVNHNPLTVQVILANDDLVNQITETVVKMGKRIDQLIDILENDKHPTI